MRLLATRKSEQNQATVDPWTVVHLSAGLALGLVGASLRWSLAAAITYEVVEQAFERPEVFQDLRAGGDFECAAGYSSFRGGSLAGTKVERELRSIARTQAVRSSSTTLRPLSIAAR